MKGPDTVRLLPFDAEARLFLRLRATLAWETVRSMLTESRLRLTLVVLLSGMFWGSLYGLFVEAFAFLEDLHADVISLLFNAFFSSLMVMLVFSTGILVYGGMYCSTEARLLLTLPTRPDIIHAHKFREAVWFSSWGFILLGSPMLAAYGVVRGSAWTYFLLMIPFMISFVTIPASLGSICCMALAAWLPRIRLHALSIAVSLACVAATWLAWSTFSQARLDTMSAAWFEQAFSRLAVTEQKFLPSWWLSTGLIEAARTEPGGAVSPGGTAEAVKFLSLLIANALAAQLVAGWLARVAYRRGYSHLAGETPARRRRRAAWFDRALGADGDAPGRPLRLLMLKDLRLFRRDVSQWSQFAIFFGLLGLYFVNLRSFNYNNSYASLIGFLNLAVVGLILSTFTTRFVYPMISLEGRRFWILGLLPVHRDEIVWSKFVFSFVGGLVPCCLLVLLSDCMLGIPWPLIAQHEFCCAMLCMGLSGIAVGLGAWMPDLREASPSKISSGFGGTLSLVISSLFIMVMVVAAAFPSQLGLLAHALGPATTADSLLARATGPWATVASLAVVLATGLIATFVPLAVGLRAFRRLEP
ncbi:MAG: putative ABC transporter permease subunit [Pirellulales bacterium]